jgi:hypothetical protein
MQPIYLIEHQGLRARYFLEIDRDSNSRSSVIQMIREKQCDPVKILEVDEDAGTVRDVTDDLVGEAMDGENVRNAHVAEPFRSILTAFSPKVRA